MPPCICGLKVERNHEKLMCQLCKQLFHVECCNVKPEDLDLIKDTFKCSICTRRSSTSATPIIAILDQGPDPAGAGAPMDNTNAANTCTDRIENVIDFSIHSSTGLLDLSMSVAPDVTPDVPSANADNLDILATLQLLVKEMADLKRINVDLVSKVTTLECSNSLLLKKVNDMERSLSRFGQDSSPKRKKNNSSSATVPQIQLAQTVIATASESAAAHKSTLPTFASVTRPTDSPQWPPLESTSAKWSTILRKNKRASVSPAPTSKSKKPVVVGQGNSEDLDVVDKKKWLHLSSFKNNVTSNDIVDYVEKHFNIPKLHLVCYSLVKKDAVVADLKHINFKLGVSAGFVEKLFDASLWPVNIKVRYFDFLEKVVDPK